MLVRLYGAEEEAAAAYEAGELAMPFTDVGATAAPYVAWLYDQGIVNGTSATTYGAASACTAQNYVVFLLRALGYQDGTDFAYADALTFAQEKGFYDPLMFPGDVPAGRPGGGDLPGPGHGPEGRQQPTCWRA